MSKNFLRWLFGFASSLLAFDSCGLSPENTAASVDPPTLEQIPDRLRESDKLILAKTSELLALVESELTAKRIPESDAQELRAALSSITPPIVVDLASVLRLSFVPAGNEAIANAFQNVQTAWEACEGQREALARLGASETARRTSEVARTAQSAADVSPLITVVERFQEAASKRLRVVSPKFDSAGFASSWAFLIALQKSYETRPLNDLEHLARLVRELDRNGKDDAKKRVAEILAPFKTAEETTHTALDAALIDRKPSSEIYAALHEYIEAQGRYFKLLKALTSVDSDYDPYWKLADVAWCIETRRYSMARAHATEAAPWMHRFKDFRKERFTQLLNQWDADITKAIEDDRLSHQEQLRKKINDVKTAEDLETLAVELRKENQYPEQEAQRYYPVQLPDQLASLATEWRSLRPAHSILQNGGDLFEASQGYRKELTSLLSQIETDVWSHFLEAPELKKPPLATQPTGAAINSLCISLADDGAWQRLFAIQKAWAAEEPAPERGPLSADAARSVHAFLAGQNFESAEEWSEAAAAYTAAVKTKQDGTLIKQATERLNALKKEHPEALPYVSGKASPRTPPHAR